MVSTVTSSKRVSGSRALVSRGTACFTACRSRSPKNGAGLGGLIGETTKRELAAKAGFSSFEVLPIEDDFMAFCFLRR